MNLAESKVRPVYRPGASSIEGLPTRLQMFHAVPLVMVKPHWHAQGEVNARLIEEDWPQRKDPNGCRHCVGGKRQRDSLSER